MSRRTRIRNIIAGILLVAMAIPILLVGLDILWKFFK